MTTKPQNEMANGLNGLDGQKGYNIAQDISRMT